MTTPAITPTFDLCLASTENRHAFALMTIDMHSGMLWKGYSDQMLLVVLCGYLFQKARHGRGQEVNDGVGSV